MTNWPDFPRIVARFQKKGGTAGFFRGVLAGENKITVTNFFFLKRESQPNE